MACLIAAVSGVALLVRQRLTPFDVMVNDSNNAVEQARQLHEIQLDYSEASIAKLDRILIGENLRDAPKEKARLRARMWGAYFGEVIRRQHGGVWKSPDLLETKGIQLSPPAKAYERAMGGSSLESFYLSLLQAWSL